MSAKGCDISVYQGSVDFDALKGAVSFVIAKATEGTGFVDSQFARSWSEAKRVGLQRGAYHFARPDLGNSADAEATDFIAHLGPLDADDLLALDYEVDWSGDVVGWCKRFLDDVYQMTAIRPLIYLNRSLLALDWSAVIAAGYPLWLASYDGSLDTVPPTPWPRVAMKQWTSGGTLAGIQGNVDLNTAFGEGGTMNKPTYAGQSVVEMNGDVGQVLMADAIYDYGAGPRHFPVKMVAYKPGIRVVEFYPPADPDADPTLVLDAQPCIFVVAAK